MCVPIEPYDVVVFHHIVLVTSRRQHFERPQLAQLGSYSRAEKTGAACDHDSFTRPPCHDVLSVKLSSTAIVSCSEASILAADSADCTDYLAVDYADFAVYKATAWSATRSNEKFASM